MPLFRLEKEFRFEAAHLLPHHDGKCGRPHGHSWRGRVIVVGSALVAAGPKVGMLIDYGDLSAAIDPLVEEFLDHRYLNLTLPLENPTSEEIARWMFRQLKPKLGDYLLAVQIDETCTSRCEYRE